MRIYGELINTEDDSDFYQKIITNCPQSKQWSSS